MKVACVFYELQKEEGGIFLSVQGQAHSWHLGNSALWGILNTFCTLGYKPKP